LKITYPLPEKVLQMIDPAEREKLGKGFRTRAEISSKVEAYNERQLHAQIRQLLNLKGIVYHESRMDKRSHSTVGWPDFTFAVFSATPHKSDPTNKLYVAIPCAWEIKVGDTKLRPEQSEMFWKLQKMPNAWRVKVIRSLKEAADELKALGI
jgi:hypothetical protein